MSTPYLTTDEINDICDPLTQPAAQIRHLQRMGMQVLRKANGRPLVARAEYERVAVRHDDGQQVSTAPANQPDIAALRAAVGKGQGNGAQAQGR